MSPSLIVPADQASGPVTRVHVVRHGEVHNPHKILYGRLPGYNLSDRGRAMADAVASYLGRSDIVYVASSPLERARQTAAPIAAAAGQFVTVEDRLIEAESKLQGEPVGKQMAAPKHWWKYRNPHRPSWNEPYEQIATRMLAAFALARHAAEGHEAVLVSHQMPIWVARLKVEGKPLMHDPRRRQCAVASVTTFEYVGQSVVGISYAEPAAHLLPHDVANDPVSAGGQE